MGAYCRRNFSWWGDEQISSQLGGTPPPVGKTLHNLNKKLHEKRKNLKVHGGGGGRGSEDFENLETTGGLDILEN